MVLPVKSKDNVPELGLGRIIQNKINFYEFNNGYGGCFTNVEIVRIANHPDVTHTMDWNVDYCANHAKVGQIFSTWFYFKTKRK